MGSRLLVPLLGVFWGVMTFLLWRAEYGTAGFSGTPLPPEIVWQKILTSPDSSSLAIVRRGERIGYCHLVSSVSEQFHASSNTNAPEGLVRHIEGYKLDLSGSLNDPASEVRIRFDGALMLNRDQAWESFRMQVIARPLVIDVQASKATGVVQVQVEGADISLTRELRLEKLRQPQAVLAEFFGPSGPLLFQALPFSLSPPAAASLERTIPWSASTDRIRLGQSTAQVYRLEAKPLEGLQVALLVSRVGEILRVELPEEVILINEALTAL